MPTVSIVVPVYKVEKYLRRCLDSIKSQTFTDWECLLIDDGSPDDSGMICDEYAEKDGRFRVFHQVNAGVSAARNKGLDESYSDWVMFVDSDDWIDNEMVAELYKCAIANQADVVVSGFKKTDGRHIEKEINVKADKLSMPMDFEWFVQYSWGKLYKMEFLNKYEIRFTEGISLAEDVGFTFLVYFNANKIFGVNQSFYNYLSHQQSVMHLIDKKMILDEIQIYENIEKNILGKAQTTDWLLWLSQRKIVAKMRSIVNLNPPDFDLFRKTFPDVSKNLYDKSFVSGLFYRMVNLKMDFLCKSIIRTKKIIDKFF